MMESILQDIRYGLRMLAKNPGFTFISVLILALGIGVNTAMYSMYHAETMISHRFADPEKLGFLRQPTEFYERSGVSALDFYDWQEQAESFSDLGIYRNKNGIITGDGEPEKTQILMAGANLMPFLGIEPQIGRFHLPEEDSPAADKVVVLSNDVWLHRYGKNP
ncbi:MAG: hypothetical protein GY869_07750, partial [Planctomycetes bacterium]|nr:hypothetical protein [Planctomycetota bacterium]